MAGGGVLDNDEVDFLLQDSRESAPGAAGASAKVGEADREVTMRGDLDQIELADIFQTLSMSKLEGVLRIQHPLEKRELYFKDGYVRCLRGNRMETFRIGQRLIRAGLLNADQLRSALLKQKQSRATLGEILVEHDLVDRADIEEIAANQLQEDLFSLFTWKHGAFAFYRGAPTDTVVIDQIERAAEFEINGVLLEVARRSDEWERIFAAVGSLDEVFVAADAELPEGCGDEHQAVLDGADGTRNVRDLSDATLLELFDCGIVVRELIELGVLVPAPVDRVLDAAQKMADDGDAKRAMLTIGALIDRGEHLEFEESTRAAQILARCGERRYASQLLVEASQNGFYRDAESLALARQARDLDRRSLPVLQRLLELLEADPTASDTEIEHVRIDLVDALSDAERYDEALEVLRELEIDASDPGVTRSQMARVLARTDRRDEAVDCLLEYAETLDRERDKARLIATYEQILRIDYRRRDIARALKSLHASKFAKRMRAGVAATVVLAIGLIGAMQFRSAATDEELATRLANLQQRLAQGDEPGAVRILGDSRQEYGEHDRVATMESAISAWRTKRTQAQAQVVEDEAETTDVKGRAMLEGGDVAAALDLYFALVESGHPRQDIEPRIAKHIERVIHRTQDAVESLLGRLPDPPTPEMSLDEQERVLAVLEAEFHPPYEATVRALVAQIDDPRVVSVLGKDHESRRRELRELDEFLRLADDRTDAYRQVRDDARVAAKLTPLFHRAQEHERAHRFEEALRDYRHLASNHPADDDLKAQFQRMVERYSSILRHLEVIDQATQRGDFEAARNQLAALEHAHPEIPFATLTLLPVRIETTPPGASVLLDGRPVGKAPLLAAYRPGAETRVRVELDGYHAEETTLTGASVGTVRSLLARRATWIHTAAATVERRPAIQRNHTLIYTDRGGHVVALRIADGEVRWRVDTDDLSGLLTPPLLLPGSNRVLVGSFDGKLRSLDVEDGSIRWTVSDIPTESAVVATGDGDLAVIPTRDGRLVAIDVSSGARIWTRELPGTVRAEGVVDGENLILATVDGDVLALRIRDGRQIWRSRAGRGVIAAPALGRGDVAVVAEDGTVTVLDAESGRVRWRRRGLPPLTANPMIAADRVMVVESRSLHCFALDGGTPRPGLESVREFDGQISGDDSLLFLADRGGVVHALEADTLDPRFLLRAPEVSLAPVVRLSDGTLIAAFQDRSVRCYAPR